MPAGWLTVWGAGGAASCSGARVGVVQALAGCGESCGLPMRPYKNSAIPVRWAGQSLPKLSKRSL